MLDPVGAAALEAAIGPLSAPVPGPGGERDRRSVQVRRGQALVEVCRRATSAGDRPPAGVKTTLILTMGLDDLAARTGAESFTLLNNDSTAWCGCGRCRGLDPDAERVRAELVERVAEVDELAARVAELEKHHGKA